MFTIVLLKNPRNTSNASQIRNNINVIYMRIRKKPAILPVIRFQLQNGSSDDDDDDDDDDDVDDVDDVDVDDVDDDDDDDDDYSS